MQRWHLLGRYYVNKWHYDSFKWADRVWYGQGSTGNGPRVASVAFMVTHSMRQQLLSADFPPSVISTLQPATAQKLIADEMTFAQFEKLRNKQQVVGASKQNSMPKEHLQSALVAAEEKEIGVEAESSAVRDIQQQNEIEDVSTKERD